MSHSFSQNKEYTVKLLVTNQFGCVSEDDSAIDITAAGIDPVLNSDPMDLDIYPNPFSQNTLISFNLPKTSHVKITIMDMKGNVLFVPVNETLGSGPNEIEINPSQAGLSPGTYFVNLQMNGKLISKKIIVLK